MQTVAIITAANEAGFHVMEQRNRFLRQAEPEGQAGCITFSARLKRLMIRSLRGSVDRLIRVYFGRSGIFSCLGRSRFMGFQGWALLV